MPPPLSAAHLLAILSSSSQEHIKREKAVMSEFDSPFLVNLVTAFQASACATLLVAARYATRCAVLCCAALLAPVVCSCLAVAECWLGA